MKRNKITGILFFLVVLILLSCQSNQQIIQQFNTRTKQIQQQYAPDLSLNVFSVNLKKEQGNWVLTGETTVPEAEKAVVALTDSLLGSGKYENRLIRLPHPALGDSIYAIVTVSVAHLREHPAHAAQMVDQYILGRTLRLLKNKGGWYLVQTDYGYIGWMRRESFVRVDKAGVEAWKSAPRVRVTALFPLIYSRPSTAAEPVSDAVLNTLLRVEGTSGHWFRVALPDGRKGYLRRADAVPLKEDVVRGDLRQAIVRTARRMMGIPYLWGGNSSKANDCSGFTQTVFKANHIDLPRDARQQALVGDEVVPDSTFSNVLPGDLLFFGSKEKIVHVGISLGGTEYIHQSGMVHLNGFDPRSERFSPYRRKTLQKIMRVLP